MIDRLNTLASGFKVMSLGKILALSGALAGGALLAPSVATAQDVPAFGDVDTNIDGVISEDEFLAAMPDMTADDFAVADVNGDTVIAPDEFEAMAAMMPQ